MISKDHYCVADVFIAYLTFAGNATKVGIALDIPPEAVAVLAAKENWAHKLKVYMSSCRIVESASGEKALRRAAIEILARHLQQVTGRVVEHLNSAADGKTLIRWLSPASAKTRGPVLQAGVLVDLSRALLLLSHILGGTKSDEPSAGEVEPPSFWEAISAVMAAADGLPGLDSVTLGKESLDAWRTNTEEPKTGEGD